MGPGQALNQVGLSWKWHSQPTGSLENPEWCGGTGALCRPTLSGPRILTQLCDLEHHLPSQMMGTLIPASQGGLENSVQLTDGAQ